MHTKKHRTYIHCTCIHTPLCTFTYKHVHVHVRRRSAVCKYTEARIMWLELEVILYSLILCSVQLPFLSTHGTCSCATLYKLDTSLVSFGSPVISIQFVISRIDCYCSLLAGLPLGTLARLDRVLRSAARLVGGCPSFLPSLPTRVMYSIGCLYLSGYSIVSLQWSPVVSLAAPPLTSATSAAKCRFWPHVGCCVLL